MLSFVLIVVAICQGILANENDYIIRPFRIGSVDGSIINFVLDFGDVDRAYNSFPVSDLHSIQNGETEFYEILYARGMTDLVPIKFQLDVSGTNVGVLSLWNSNVSFCYQNYQQDEESNLFLGQLCMDKHVFGGTIVEYGPYDTHKAMGEDMLTVIRTINDSAIEYNHNENELKFKVYKDLPDMENISTITLPLILIVFFMVWLGWTKEISSGSKKRKTPQDTGHPTWETITSTYALAIVDIISICVTTVTLDMIHGFSVLRGGSAIQMIGEKNAKFVLELCWTGSFYVLTVLILFVLAFGATKSTQEENIPPTRRWFTVIQICIVIVGVGASYPLARYSEGITDTGWLIGIPIFAFIILSCVVFYNKILRALKGNDSRGFLFEIEEAIGEMPLLLTFRWSVEIIVLTTLHATLPTVLGSTITTVYRTGIGFAIGITLSVVTGRDIAWIFYHSIFQCKSECKRWQRVARYIFWAMLLVLVVAVEMYVCVFLLGPVFMTSVQLEQESTLCLLLSISLGAQSLSIGGIYATSRFVT